MNLHIFCHPKPWLPEFNAIQHSAIQSWLLLKPKTIYLLGSDSGTAEASLQYGLKHIPDIKCNKFGTPLVSSIFEAITKATSCGDIVCYVNADIIFDETFNQTLSLLVQESKDKKEWLGVGKRTDVDLSIDENGNPESIITVDAQQLADERGVDHGWGGIDYFLFPSGTFKFVYPFALGKFVWDQWLVGNAFRRGIWTVDCTKTLLAIHLNSPWYKDGKPTTNRQAIYDSDEGTHNRSFDYYQKTILSGTQFQTILGKDGLIQIKKKTLIPDL